MGTSSNYLDRKKENTLRSNSLSTVLSSPHHGHTLFLSMLHNFYLTTPLVAQILRTLLIYFPAWQLLLFLQHLYTLKASATEFKPPSSAEPLLFAACCSWATSFSKLAIFFIYHSLSGKWTSNKCRPSFLGIPRYLKISSKIRFTDKDIKGQRINEDESSSSKKE